MAGAHLDVDVIGLGRVQRVLARLSDASQDVDPILRDIGEYLLTQTRTRFDDEVDATGRPWEPLEPGYAKAKAEERPNAGILVYDNFLRGTLAYVVSAGELALGTNLPYGARQHFGFTGPDSLGRTFDHPARPWLGVSSGDESEIVGILRQHLLDADIG